MGGRRGGIYIRCDSCGKTIGGEECGENGLLWNQSHKLQQFAMSKGWTGDLTRESNNDKCPECCNQAAIQSRKK